MTTTTFAILDLDAAFAAMDAMDAPAAPGSDVLAFLLGNTTALPAGFAPAVETPAAYAAPIGPAPACPACDGRGVLRSVRLVRGAIKRTRGACQFCRGCGADTGNHTPALLALIAPARGSNIYTNVAR